VIGRHKKILTARRKVAVAGCKMPQSKREGVKEQSELATFPGCRSIQKATATGDKGC